MNDAKTDVLQRLRKIEGQVKGIQKMIEADKCCQDVLIQIAAVRAATTKVGGIVLENYSKECIKKSMCEESEDESINNLINTILKFMK